jgi:DNA-binding NarL/FixJ family response regulator
LGAEGWAAELAAGRVLDPDAVLNIVHERDLPRADSPAKVRRTPTATLTPREREVAELAANGLSNRRISEILTIAEKTAANHLQNALDKLEVHSRSQLAARAVELGLVSVPK